MLRSALCPLLDLMVIAGPRMLGGTIGRLQSMDAVLQIEQRIAQ